MKAPPLLPVEIFQRVTRLARFDGLSVVAVAGVFALIAAAMGDYVGAVIGVLVAGAGAIELHGVALLRHGDAQGMRWLIGSQFFLMASVLGYCGLRLAHPDLVPLRAAISDDLKAQLDMLGMTVDQFLVQFYRLVYLAVAFVTVLYQGGMALYYLGKRSAVETALKPE